MSPFLLFSSSSSLEHGLEEKDVMILLPKKEGGEERKIMELGIPSQASNKKMSK